MQTPNPQRVSELHALIATFLSERRDEKLATIKADDPKREELRQRYEFATWINDAARLVAYLQLVTHTIKPSHPKAEGTEFLVHPPSLTSLNVVGSHALGDAFIGDVAGNAASLAVYKFLKLTHAGQTLLSLMLEQDIDLAAALSDDPAKAQNWMQAFAGITQPRGTTSSHALAKQLYWLVGEDTRHDDGYHLLAPLYATSLAHRVFESIRDDRFSDAAKDARQAKRVGLFNARPVHEYTQLCVQKLGGTKPQNISQLNSERGGNNYLLASLPPLWQTRDVTPLLRTQTLFNRFERRPVARKLVKTLLDFLKTDPRTNLETRERRDALVEELLDELLLFAAALRNLEPGWSQQPDCDLSPAEKHWLDPDGVAAAADATGVPLPTDSAEAVSKAFAQWLNQQLRDPLPTGEPEYQHWRKLALDQLEAEDWEASHAS
jgi:CRISPR-associated protein Csy1